MSSDGSGYVFAFILAYLLFSGDPDIADALLQLLLKAAQ